MLKLIHYNYVEKHIQTSVGPKFFLVGLSWRKNTNKEGISYLHVNIFIFHKRIHLTFFIKNKNRR